MKATFLNTCSSSEQVPLGMLLDHLGHRPAKIKGDEHLYYNVLKSADTRSTFVVNGHLNIWYDRLTKKSGNVIDFCVAYWPELDRVQVSEKLDQIVQLIANSQKIHVPLTGRRKRLGIKVPFYHIAETRPVGCNTEITSYLQSQEIWEISIGHLKEVYYYVIDEKGKRKDFFAAGWQNENSGWEVRGRNFSGCLGKKGMTFIPGNMDSLILFEDYLEYLRWKRTNIPSSPSILVINSPEFLDAAKKRLTKFRDVAVFFGKQYLDDETLSAIQKLDPQKIVLVP